jgi:hypothetical protein
MPLPKTTVQVPFGPPETTVAAATQATLEDVSPANGSLKSITLHFPAGCNALVDIVVYLKQMQILPLTGKIALNDATVTFDINRPTTRGDKLSAVIANRDSANSHTPSIIFTIEGTPTG